MYSSGSAFLLSLCISRVSRHRHHHPPPQAEGNVPKLEAMIQRFIDAVFASLEEAPPQYRVICRMLRTYVDRGLERACAQPPLTLPTN